MGYKNFDVAIYCTIFDLNYINDFDKFAEHFNFIEKHIKCTKVYLETYRSNVLIEKEKMLKIKEIFNNKGIKTSGGITPTVYTGKPGFESLCYTNSEHRDKLRQIVEYTASMFDEIILDDFYFTNCKCESCIKAKGDRSWAEFRTELLQKVSVDDIIAPAKRINPNVNVIIKYPNWYEHYQNTGYNLKEQPQVFDMIYTGTETRDPQYTQQNLQRYLSYFLMRYMENVKPDKNGGGWFDAFDCSYNLGSYAEQAYLTLFSKAKEVTLFCLGLLLARARMFVPIAGYAFDTVDYFLDKLGNPVGVSCYKPYHSSGEDHLYDYLGMLGIPLEPTPYFPEQSNMVLLTASAAGDPDIVDKLKAHLLIGKKAVITSGLLKALDGCIDGVALLKYTDKKAVVDKFACYTSTCAYKNYYNSSEVLIPQVEYSTNDSWPIIVGLSENNSFPILLQAEYGKGILYVLTIPENFGELYNLPAEVLKPIREFLMKDLSVTLDCAGKVGLFMYDNDTFIVESFLPYNSDVDIVVNKSGVRLVDIGFSLNSEPQVLDGVGVDGGTKFSINMLPSTFRVFRIESL